MSQTYTEYGVFTRHGSSEVLLKTFRKPETIGIWRRMHPDFEVTRIRIRTVTKGEWFDSSAEDALLNRSGE
jgi:hypothetical protein